MPAPRKADVIERVLVAVEVPRTRAARYAAPLAAAAEAYGINTDLRLSHWLAQILHESGLLRFEVELWGPTDAQRRYEGRRDLGNVRPGDGHRFRGRGLIQLTGRSNYRQYSKAKGVDFEADPDLVASPTYAADVAGWYWNTRRLNDLADRGGDTKDVMAITRKVNGGYNGLEHRQKMFDRVLYHLAKEKAKPAPFQVPESGTPAPVPVDVLGPEPLPSPSLFGSIRKRVSDWFERGELS